MSREGYIASETNVVVARVMGAEQEVELTIVAALVTLNVVTEPTGAEVYLDEVYKGTSNSKGLLVLDGINPSQPHKLRIAKTGYTQQSDIPVTTYNGQTSVKLLSDSIQVKISTDPPGTEVYFDDSYKGTSTADGLLMIDQVNPNQPHRVRGKKAPEYIEQIRLLPANSSEVSIKLLPDPIFLLAKDVKQQLADTHLLKAFEGYAKLVLDAPDHAELPRLLESILQSVQLKSADNLKRLESFGLAIDADDAAEMKQLYDYARKWRAGDEAIETMGKYWDVKLAFVKADRIASASEKESLRRNAKPILTDLSERNLRNIYLLMEVGWAWLKLSEAGLAQKYFNAAQELKPDWPYPYFATGVLAMQAADRETKQQPKFAKCQQAIDSLTKAISVKHDFPRAYALRAIAYAIMKKHEESTASGLQAIAIDPKSAYAHYALGYAYFQKGKSAYRNSRDEFNRALALTGGELNDATRNLIQERLTQISKAIK